MRVMREGHLRNECSLGCLWVEGKLTWLSWLLWGTPYILPAITPTSNSTSPTSELLNRFSSCILFMDWFPQAPIKKKKKIGVSLNFPDLETYWLRPSPVRLSTPIPSDSSYTDSMGFQYGLKPGLQDSQSNSTTYQLDNLGPQFPHLKLWLLPAMLHIVV